MTIMVDSLLRQSTSSVSSSDPATILHHLERGIGETLQTVDGAGTVRTGLDIGLCACFPDRSVLIYSGAAMPLYVREADGRVNAVGGRRRSIKSNHRTPPKGFPNRELHTEGRVFSLVTDGFVDQPGGRNGRAYGTTRLTAFLRDVNLTDGDHTSSRWAAEFDDYRGDESQRDDVLALSFVL